MNSQCVRDKLKELAKEKNISFNILLREYMYERFIKRLSISEYRLNFILKGGYYLSTVFGIENRSTMDIDACLKNNELSKENLLKIITDIISIDIKDEAIFTIDSINLIREEDEYGGYRVSLKVRIDNMKDSFHLDVVTGEPITPSEIIYKYKPIIEKQYIHILAYNLETVLAEKLETILTRGEMNSRMKDYQDIYLIMTLKYDDINMKHLREAINKTFDNRDFCGEIDELFKDVKNSLILKSRWESYSKRKRIKHVSFLDTIDCVKKLIDIIKLTKV